MAGTSIKLSTPPKLSAKVKISTLLRKERLAHPWLIQRNHATKSRHLFLRNFVTRMTR